MNDTSTSQKGSAQGYKHYPAKTYLTFLIPSLMGLFLFMAPMSYEGSYTIPVAVLAKSLRRTTK